MFKDIMIKGFFITSIICLSGVIGASGQAQFVSTGKIEYEKKVNMWKSMEDNEWSRPLKDKFGEYSISYHDLLFNDSVAVYKAGRENPNDKWKDTWNSVSNSKNIVYQNFTSNRSSLIRQVFDQDFFVSDSLLPIEWHMQDEIRSIAGFDCRKAVGKIYDSLYVVAFFTDQLILPAGPEQFSGLPGTILGLAFPRYHITWFATNVELVVPSKEDLKKPEAGRRMDVVDRKKLIETAKGAANWGSEAEKQQLIWTTVLL